MKRFLLASSSTDESNLLFFAAGVETSSALRFLGAGASSSLSSDDPSEPESEPDDPSSESDDPAPESESDSEEAWRGQNREKAR